MNRTLELTQQRAALHDQAQAIIKLAETEKRSMTSEELASASTLAGQMEGINNTLAMEARMAGMSAAVTGGSRPTAGATGLVIHDNTLDKPYASFGEQLLAVRESALRPDKTDPRLYEMQKRAAAAGASEAVPADGGFLVQPDFASELLKIAHDTGIIYPKAQMLPLSDATNATKIAGVDEQSRANGSRWGGVQMYWQNEADALTGSKPKFRLMELVTKKLTGLYYATDELLTDARLLGAIVTQAFGEELGFKLDDGVIRGTGAGQLQGILNSPALVSVAKETGQTAATIVWENIKNMTAQCWPRSFARAEWYVNINCLPGLMSMVQVVGTAGVPVWLPPGAASTSPYGTLMGRPLNVIEQADTIGTVGDIFLADFSQYVMVDKGQMQSAVSMHVRFLTDEQTFRWIYRVDGQPMWHTALTPFKGANKLSPFVALATRA